jgi:5'-nucleotidase
MARPVILVSNDDGISAPGLLALVEALERVGEVWVVAPDGERSTASHALTLREPLVVRRVGERSFAVNGWPADCVYLGMFGLLPRRPDMVVSGINVGPNLGTDVIYSGTVAAAREAFLRGVPSIAVSLVEGDDQGLAARFTAELAQTLLEGGGEALLLNVNIPGAKARGVRVASLGERWYPERAQLVGQSGEGELYKIGGPPLRSGGAPGTDAQAVEEGYIAVTPLSIDQTSKGQLALVSEVLASSGVGAEG